MVVLTKKWCDLLKEKGYNHKLPKNGCKKIHNLGRLWKTIFKHTQQNINGLNVFEFGCGGAKQLIPLASNGSKCMGLDCSKEVLNRAKIYVTEITKKCNINLNIKFVCKDFMKYNSKNKFDLVFHVGVLEHFLDDKERLSALAKMFELTNNNGYIISVVPSGIHPIRKKIKKLKLGGYKIPEIDYSPKIMQEEMEKCGGKDIIILPYNIFGYLLDDINSNFYFIKKLFYYFAQTIPLSLLPKPFTYRHSAVLIGIAKK